MLTSDHGHQRQIAHWGTLFTIAYALCLDYSSPGAEFYDRQDSSSKAKLNTLFQLLGNAGRISNREKFKKLEDEIWQFKSYQIRMPCAFTSNRIVVVTHGFVKKGDDTPRAEIVRAKRILAEDLSVFGKWNT